MRKECTLEWVDHDGNVIPNNIIKLPNDVVKEHIDVIEVILCKDCRHANKSMFCSVYLQPRLPNDFCNYGERREP